MANKHYKITNWKGHKNYECRHCAFATLNRREINQHIDVHIRGGLVEVDDAATAPGDENYGLDVDTKANKAAKKQAAKATKAAAKAAKESKHG